MSPFLRTIFCAVAVACTSSSEILCAVTNELRELDSLLSGLTPTYASAGKLAAGSEGMTLLLSVDTLPSLLGAGNRIGMLNMNQFKNDN